VPGVLSFELYARAVRDHLDGRRDVAVHFERDDGYRSRSEVAGLVAPFWKWPHDERDAIREARGRVLDVGCGPGRVGVYLQRKRHEVVGIDPSPAMRRLARERGVRTVLEGSLWNLPRDRGPFDTVVLYGNNFGLAGTVAGTTGFLRRLRRITTGKARILANCVTPGGPGTTHWAYLRRNLERGRPPGQITLRVAYGGRRGDWFDLLLVGWDGMARIAHAGGWTITNLWANRQHAGRYTALLEKESG
jgi:SAM-dependent methyltransferase